MVKNDLQMSVRNNRLERRERSCRHYNFANRGIMRNNYRRKSKKSSQIHCFEPLTIEDFETYCTIQLNDMVSADRQLDTTVDNYGCKSFSEAGLRDEGHGVFVRLKSGETYLLKITQV